MSATSVARAATPAAGWGVGDVVRATGATVVQRGSAVDFTGLEQMGRVTIAYEPVWAIGTGQVASPQDASAVHQMIRRSVADLYNQDTAGELRIQYGGSVNASNARDLFAEPQIDGGLVGGASLDSQQFKAIVEAAVQATEEKREASTA